MGQVEGIKSTARLLASPVVVAISGWCRLYIAFLLLGLGPRLKVCTAFALVVYSVYLLDRAIGGEEDEINRMELKTAKKNWGIIASFTAFSSSIFLSGNPLSSFMPYIIGFAYSRGIHIGNTPFKLKGGCGMKNIIVALTWGITIVLFIMPWAENLISLLVIFGFFFTKSFINTVIYDFRDIQGDFRAGIQTLPVELGESKTRSFLQFFNFALHLLLAMAMILEVVSFEFVIFFTCLVSGIIYTTFLTKSLDKEDSFTKKIFRDAIVDGEFILAVILRKSFDYISSLIYLDSTRTILSPTTVQFH